MVVRLNLRVGQQMYEANSYYIFKRVKNRVEFPFLYSLTFWTNLNVMRSCLITSHNEGTTPQMLKRLVRSIPVLSLL